MARLVVAAVVAEEALVRPRQLLGAVGGERLDAARRGGAARRLASSRRAVVRGARPGARPSPRTRGAEALDVVAERVVEQADLDRPPGADRLERRRRSARPSSSCADAARQQVGPVLGAVEAAHVPVVGVQHDVLARDHVVGRERERHAAGRGVAGQRRDRPGASRSRRSRGRRRRSRAGSATTRRPGRRPPRSRSGGCRWRRSRGRPSAR